MGIFDFLKGKKSPLSDAPSYGDALEAALVAARGAYLSFFSRALTELKGTGIPHATEICLGRPGDEESLNRAVVDALIKKDDGGHEAVEFQSTELERSAPFSVYRHDRELHVSPFVWCAIEIRFRSKSDPTPALGEWFSRWLPDNYEPRAPEGFCEIPHHIELTAEDVDSQRRTWSIVVDLGSAPIAAANALLALVCEHAESKVEVGSFVLLASK